MNSIQTPAFDDDATIGLTQIVRLLWRHKLAIMACTLVGGLIALWLALVSIPYFRAETLVTEVRDRGMSGMGALASQLGGLASLAGVNLTPGAAAASQESAAILESNHLAAEFIRRNDLIPQLLKGSKEQVTLWRAVKAFKEGVLTIRKDPRKGVTSVSVEWTDPAIAARWANGFVALANEIIRSRALDESTRNIAYLNEQIAGTNVVELRKVMFDIIETETKTVMLAKGRSEYAFEVVDPAVTPELKSRPHRALMVLVGLVLGSVFGALVAFVLDRRRAFRDTPA